MKGRLHVLPLSETVRLLRHRLLGRQAPRRSATIRPSPWRPARRGRRRPRHAVRGVRPWHEDRSPPRSHSSPPRTVTSSGLAAHPDTARVAPCDVHVQWPRDGGDRRSHTQHATDFPRRQCTGDVHTRRCRRGLVRAPGLTLRAWLPGVPELRPPTLTDLDYHLGTLFPPVRPRGWLELRMIDAQDGDDWVVPTVPAATLLNNTAAADAAYAATEQLCRHSRRPVPSNDVWLRAARTGLDDQDLAKAARACFAAAESALAVPGTPAVLRHVLTEFAERYTERGRSPAHDHLDALRRT
ncbi:glutamate-cysteine ligase family protein [Streptomyces sp. NPDC005423]|uniref:glutamate-cysteine ligase family protein n=1 Tax=Streptomyces sp. NPDC005423 TaxID=3155343 RepID=UPI0033A57650